MPMDVNLLDNIITRLLEVRSFRWPRQVRFKADEIRQLCLATKEIFIKQPNLLELKGPINVCGDVHGQYSDLLQLLEYGGLPPMARYLFLGNYVDYGKQSLETICLLFAFKVKYPEDFFLLRGNHECASVTRIYGFYDECKRRFNVPLWETFIDCFNCLPVAAVIDKKIFCVHGGLSPDLKELGQIKNIPRPVDVPDHGLLCDLLWADPYRDIEGWGVNDSAVSYTFGADKVLQFLMKHDLDLICQGTQVMEDGYEFFAKRGMVTIFSAPNFRGEFDNAGALMSIDDSLMPSFQILKPSDKKVIKLGLNNTSSKGSSSQPRQNALGRAATTAVVNEQVLTPARAPSTTKTSRPVAPPREKMRSVTPPLRKSKSPPREKIKSPTREKRKSKSPPREKIKSPIRENKKPLRKSKSPPREKIKSPTREKIKSVTTPPKNKSRPVTPARNTASRPVTPLRMNFLRPFTPPRKNILRSETPLRKEQKQ